MMNLLTTCAPRSTASSREVMAPSRSLQPVCGCVRTRSGDAFLTCKKQVLRNPLSKKTLARLAVINEYGERYESVLNFANVTDPREYF